MRLIDNINRRYAVVMFVTAAAVVAAACGGGGDDDDRSAASASDAAPASTQSEIEPSSEAQATEQVAPESDAAPGNTFEGEGLVAGAGAFDWRIRRVDQGTKPDIALDADGSALVAYLLERQGNAGWVRVARADGAGFAIDEVHQGYNYGPLDLEVSSAGVAAVAYHFHPWEDAAVALRDDAGAWQVTRVADPIGHDGWDTSLAFGADGSLHLLGVDPVQFGSSDGLEYATFVDGEWRVQAIGSGPQPYEWGTDIAVDADGVLHVVYFDAANQDLVYGRNDGSGWQLQTIYEHGDAGRFAVLALDDADLPHVSFLQSDTPITEEGRAPGNVVYGAFDGAAWSFEVIGAVPSQVTGFEGARRTVALEFAGGEPVVAFIDEASLQLATRAGSVWSVETVLAAGDDPFQVVGLAVDGEGAPHLTFSTVSSNRPIDGEVWYVAPVGKA